MGLTRHPVPLRDQRDLHLVLAVAVVDLALTVHGITGGAGRELNPFYAPLTGSLPLMVVGAAGYLGLLVAAGAVVTGDVRRVLAAVVFGMHVGGTLSWLAAGGLPLNWWWLMLAATGATALFYHAFRDG